MSTTRKSNFSLLYVEEPGDTEFREFETKHNGTLRRIRRLSDSLDRTSQLHSIGLKKHIMKSVQNVTQKYRDTFKTTKNKDYLKPRELIRELIDLRKRYNHNKKIKEVFNYIYNRLTECQTGDALPLCEIIVTNNDGKSINTVNTLLEPMNEFIIKNNSSASGKRKKTNRMKRKLPAKKRKTKRKYN